MIKKNENDNNDNVVVTRCATHGLEFSLAILLQHCRKMGLAIYIHTGNF